MKTVNTPFGEVNLDTSPIQFWIKDSSIGSKQLVRYEGIQSQSETHEYANILWIIDQYDQDGVTKLNELHAVQGRQVMTPINGYNRVTDSGVLILRESFPQTEAGQVAFQKLWDAGHNEYRYWTALLRIAPLPNIIEAAGNLLAQYDRFDRF